MTASAVAVGTPAVQLAAMLQSVLVVPLQDVCASAARGATSIVTKIVAVNRSRCIGCETGLCFWRQGNAARRQAARISQPISSLAVLAKVGRSFGREHSSSAIGETRSTLGQS